MSKKDPNHRSIHQKLHDANIYHDTHSHVEEDVLVVAPADYRNLKDVSDDYELASKMLASKKVVRSKVEQGINGEELDAYGPKTNYKSAYRYNGDD